MDPGFLYERPFVDTAHEGPQQVSDIEITKKLVEVSGALTKARRSGGAIAFPWLKGAHWLAQSHELMFLVAESGRHAPATLHGVFRSLAIIAAPDENLSETRNAEKVEAR